MVARARRVFGYGSLSTVSRRPHDAEKLADNMAHCTGLCCTGPRRSETGVYRLTMRERRAALSARVDEAVERRLASVPD
jgi:hypothetical protein